MLTARSPHRTTATRRLRLSFTHKSREAPLDAENADLQIGPDWAVRRYQHPERGYISEPLLQTEDVGKGEACAQGSDKWPPVLTCTAVCRRLEKTPHRRLNVVRLPAPGLQPADGRVEFCLRRLAG